MFVVAAVVLLLHRCVVVAVVGVVDVAVAAAVC